MATVCHGPSFYRIINVFFRHQARIFAMVVIRLARGGAKKRPVLQRRRRRLAQPSRRSVHRARRFLQPDRRRVAKKRCAFARTVSITGSTKGCQAVGYRGGLGQAGRGNAADGGRAGDRWCAKANEFERGDGLRRHGAGDRLYGVQGWIKARTFTASPSGAARVPGVAGSQRATIDGASLRCSKRACMRTRWSHGSRD